MEYTEWYDYFNTPFTVKSSNNKISLPFFYDEAFTIKIAEGFSFSKEQEEGHLVDQINTNQPKEDTQFIFSNINEEVRSNMNNFLGLNERYEESTPNFKAKGQVIFDSGRRTQPRRPILQKE